MVHLLNKFEAKTDSTADCHTGIQTLWKSVHGTLWSLKISVRMQIPSKVPTGTQAPSALSP